MNLLFSNNASTTLAADVIPADGTITVVDASDFPTLVEPDDAYVLTMEDVSGSIEYILVTAVGGGGNTLTVTRDWENYEGAKSFLTGDRVELRTTAGSLSTIRDYTLSILGTRFYGVDTSVAPDVYEVDVSPIPASIHDGYRLVFVANNTNTGASTLNLNSISTDFIYKFGDVPLTPGDIVSGQLVVVVYDGANWQLESPYPQQTIFLNDQTAAPTLDPLATALYSKDGELMAGIVAGTHHAVLVAPENHTPNRILHTLAGCLMGDTGVDSSEFSSFFESGNRMIWDQATPPVGWTTDTSKDERALRIKGAAAAGGGVGGTVNFIDAFGATSVTEGHVLTVDELPAHGHDYWSAWMGSEVFGDGRDISSMGNGAQGDRLESWAQKWTSATVGAGEAHTHGMPELKYTNVILAEKD